MKGKSMNVSKLGFKYEGKLVRTVRVSSVIKGGRSAKGEQQEWIQGPTMVWINGKRVPTIKGYKVVRKVYKKIAENYEKNKEYTL